MSTYPGKNIYNTINVPGSSSGNIIVTGIQILGAQKGDTLVIGDTIGDVAGLALGPTNDIYTSNPTGNGLPGWSNDVNCNNVVCNSLAINGLPQGALIAQNGSTFGYVPLGSPNTILSAGTLDPVYQTLQTLITDNPSLNFSTISVTTENISGAGNNINILSGAGINVDGTSSIVGQVGSIIDADTLKCSTLSFTYFTPKSGILRVLNNNVYVDTETIYAVNAGTIIPTVPTSTLYTFTDYFTNSRSYIVTLSFQYGTSSSTFFSTFSIRISVQCTNNSNWYSYWISNCYNCVYFYSNNRNLILCICWYNKLKLYFE